MGKDWVKKATKESFLVIVEIVEMQQIFASKNLELATVYDFSFKASVIRFSFLYCWKNNEGHICHSISDLIAVINNGFVRKVQNRVYRLYPDSSAKKCLKKTTTVEKKKCPITSTSSSLSTPHFHFQNKTFLHDVLQHFKTVNPVLFWESMKVKANMRSWWQAWGFSALSNGHCWSKTTNITFFKPTKPKYFFLRNTTFLFPFFNNSCFLHVSFSFSPLNCTGKHKYSHNHITGKRTFEPDSLWHSSSIQRQQNKFSLVAIEIKGCQGV